MIFENQTISATNLISGKNYLQNIPHLLELKQCPFSISAKQFLFSGFAFFLPQLNYWL